MKQCVMCNKSVLFAPKLKKLKEQGNNNIIVEQKKFLNVLEVKDINPFLYEIEIHSMYLNSIKFFSFNLIKFEFNN